MPLCPSSRLETIPSAQHRRPVHVHHGSRQPHHPRHFPFPSLLRCAASTVPSALHPPSIAFDRRKLRGRRHIAPSPSACFRNLHPSHHRSTAGTTSPASQPPPLRSRHHGWPHFRCRRCWVPFRAGPSSAVLRPAPAQRPDRPAVARGRRLRQSDVSALQLHAAARSVRCIASC